MSNDSPGAVLVRLSKTDTEILQVSRKVKELEDQRAQDRRAMSDVRDKLSGLEQKKTDELERQQREEARLKHEEQRIVERRKQLTALGGTRGAKLVEREIDIASRTLQTMEERTIQAISSVEHIDKEIAALKEDLERKQLDFETKSGAFEKDLDALNAELKEKRGQRDELFQRLEDRMKALYSRVQQRYPAGAVARAEDGSCRACFRALPAQTYNLILAGSVTLQCPGCSRILVALKE